MTTLIVCFIFLFIGLAILILSGCFPTVNRLFIIPVLCQIMTLCVILQVTRHLEHALNDALMTLNACSERP